MAPEECTTEEGSVATSASTTNWWGDNLHATSLSSWNNNTSMQWNQQHNPNSTNSSCDEDVSISTSFTNASTHSGLTVESSTVHLVEHQPPSCNGLIGEHATDNHLWSHLLSSVGSNEELQHEELFEPACDYSRKKDNNNNSWEFSSLTSFTNFDKQFNGYNENLIESERLTKLSNLVSNWSIAPPDPEINHQFESQPCNISLSSSTDHYIPSDHIRHMKQAFSDSTSCGRGTSTMNSGLYSCYGHDDHLKVENEHGEIEGPAGPLFQGSFSSNNIGYPFSLNSSMVGENSKHYYGMHDASCTNNARNFADIISFSGRLSKSLVDIHASKPCLKSLNLSDCKKQGVQTSSLTRNNGRGPGITNEGKKKRSEDTPETGLKKPKHESPTVSPVKMQAPKVKLGDRITALQQIVAPFGKTDTASVLLEAIGYIRFLQEQVQLLSNPYMKTNTKKDPWGGLDRKDEGDAKLDLKSRGLCLIPVSCTPHIYRDNTGSDYWTPTYRGCLYR